MLKLNSKLNVAISPSTPGSADIRRVGKHLLFASERVL